jgi:hypothetical protein
MGLAVLTNYYKYREAASGKNNLDFFQSKTGYAGVIADWSESSKHFCNGNLNVSRREHLPPDEAGHAAVSLPILPSIPFPATIPV